MFQNKYLFIVLLAFTFKTYSKNKIRFNSKYWAVLVEYSYKHYLSPEFRPAYLVGNILRLFNNVIYFQYFNMVPCGMTATLP